MVGRRRTMYDKPISPVEAEMGPGERLIWSGQPRQGVRLRGTDLIFIPFSLVWGGFAIFWEVMVIKMRAPIFMALFGIPFVVIGLYMMIGRFFFDAAARRRTFYGVSDRRVIVVDGVFSRRTRSTDLRNLSDMTLSERRDGSGTIQFGLSAAMARYVPVGMGGYPHLIAPSFEMIDRVREVFELIRNAQGEDGRREVRPQV